SRPGRQQPDDRQARRGLAASGLTHDAERLARLQREADAVDRLDDAGAAKRHVAGWQAGHLQQWLQVRCPGWRLNGGVRLAGSQSPSSWAASTHSRMPGPGKIVSHQSPTISIERPSASIEPHAGWGAGTPTPRKDSDASAMMTTPIVRLASTIAELSTFGTMC